MSSPSNKIVPALAGSRPISVFTRVVLPFRAGHRQVLAGCQSEVDPA